MDGTIDRPVKIALSTADEATSTNLTACPSRQGSDDERIG
jgi:hypothetical protein